jgi:pyruvate/2-oxoglutarate dehydrogenase complex dihydrolipoamide dehydrogenase (E3) component
MSQPERCEMLVHGSGAGGKLLAWQMAKSGHRTAVVERMLIGARAPIPTVFPANEI